MNIRILGFLVTGALGSATFGCAASGASLLEEGIAAESEYALGHDLDLHDRAAARYEAACRGGVEHACFFFERLMVSTRLSAGDFDKRERRFRPRCDAGDSRACFMWAMALDDERGFGLDSARALKLYRKACDGGYTYACAEAAKLHVVLSDHPVSVVESRQLVEKACDAGYGRSCVVAANLIRAGRGGPRDRARSRELLHAACRRGQPDACERLAKRLIYRDRKGLEPGAAARAPDVLLQLLDPLAFACRQGHQSGCMAALNLALLPLPKPMSQRASRLLDEGCHEGQLVQACDLLEVGVLEGHIPPPARWQNVTESARRQHTQTVRERSKTRQARALSGRCELGYPGACRRLAAMPSMRGESGSQRLQRLDVARNKERRWRRVNASFELNYLREGCFDDARLENCLSLTEKKYLLDAGGGTATLVEEARQRFATLYAARTQKRVDQARQGCRRDEAFSCYRLASELARTPKPSASKLQEIARARAKARRLEGELRKRFRDASKPD